MQALYDSAKDISTEEKLAIFISRFDKIEDHYSDYDAVQEEMFSLCLKLEDVTSQQASMEQSNHFEEIYYKIKAFARSRSIKTPQERQF